jgi:zinc/manganese transport system substrate-binding protein
MKKHFLRWCVVGLGVLIFAGCGQSAKSAREKPVAVATTTMIGDMVREVAGERVEVKVILKPGQDPHIYKPVPSDPKTIAESDIVFINGLRLEEWIEEMIAHAGGRRPVVVVSKGIEPLFSPQLNKPDPHCWFDVTLAMKYVENIRDALIEFDPAGETVYRENAEKYLRELEELDAWVFEQVAQIPPHHRKLVTSHDAFGYFGRRYGFQVVAVQGVSTEAAAQAQDVARLIDYIRREKIPAIFVETSVNPKLVEQIARETGAKIGGTLFSDSTDWPDQPGGTYIGMVRENIKTIVGALQP